MSLAGTILSYYILSEKAYTAYQIIYHAPESNTIGLLALDYYDNLSVALESIHLLKPLILDFAYYSNRPEYDYVELSDTIPEEYIPVGKAELPALDETLMPETVFPGDYYELPMIVDRQNWLRLPEGFRTAYYEARRDPKKVIVRGESFLSNKTDEFANFSPSFEELELFPCRTRLFMRDDPDGLALPFLRKHPQYNVFYYCKHSQTVLDFRETSVQSLNINVDNVSSIYLSPCTRSLQLLESPDAEADLEIIPCDYEQLVSLRFNGQLFLENTASFKIQYLSLYYMDAVDIAEIYRVFPMLHGLYIHGNSRNDFNVRLDNVDMLKNFKKLRVLDIYGASGFNISDFPPPEEMPSLNMLKMYVKEKSIAEKLSHFNHTSAHKYFNIYA